jgi:hypothetical protein
MRLFVLSLVAIVSLSISLPGAPFASPRVQPDTSAFPRVAEVRDISCRKEAVSRFTVCHVYLTGRRSVAASIQFDPTNSRTEWLSPVVVP